MKELTMHEVLSPESLRTEPEDGQLRLPAFWDLRGEWWWHTIYLLLSIVLTAEYEKGIEYTRKKDSLLSSESVSIYLTN